MPCHRPTRREPGYDSLHWIVRGELAVGGCYVAAESERLMAEGITALLNLQHEHERPPAPAEVRERFTWRRIPLPDHEPPALAALDEAVRQLARWRREGQRTLVHCWEGQGRSPLVAMAYLVAVHGCRLTHAIAHVQRMRPHADPNVAQLKRLCEYVERLLAAQAQGTWPGVPIE